MERSLSELYVEPTARPVTPQRLLGRKGGGTRRQQKAGKRENVSIYLLSGEYELLARHAMRCGVSVSRAIKTLAIQALAAESNPEEAPSP